MRSEAPLAHISTEGPSTSQACHVTSHRVGRDKCGLTALLHISLHLRIISPRPPSHSLPFLRVILPPPLLGSSVSVTSWAVGCPVLCSAGEADHVRTSGEEPDRESQVVGEGEWGCGGGGHEAGQLGRGAGGGWEVRGGARRRTWRQQWHSTQEHPTTAPS